MSRYRTQYRALTEQEKALVAAIKETAGALDQHIEGVADARSKALAHTKLEESVMWAVKGITG